MHVATNTMYASYIVKRTQIYLEDTQAAELGRRARARGATASRMIREAIDAYLAEPDVAAERDARYRAALNEAFGVAPYLPDGATYVEQLRGIERSHQAELEARRLSRG